MTVDMIPLIGLGALLGLDVVSFPQAMISRPLVAATLAGALIGDAERGLLLGAVLEMVALGTLPFGASRYPDWGSASVVGGALYAHVTAVQPGHLALAVLATLLAAWFSGESMVWLRKLNAHEARRVIASLERGEPVAVRRVHWKGFIADFVRAGAVTAIGLALLWPAFDAVAPLWTGGAVTERAAVAGITAALGCATIWMLVRGATGARRLLAAGIGVGAVLLLA